MKDEGVYIFSKCINSKMIARLELQLAYYDVIAQQPTVTSHTYLSIIPSTFPNCHHLPIHVIFIPPMACQHRIYS